MDKDVSLLSLLDSTTKKKIYVVGDFGIDIVGYGDVTCWRGWIADVFHVPCLNKNLLLVSQLTQTGKIVEFWLDHIFIKDMKKNKSIVIDRVLDFKDRLYKFHNLPLESRSTTLIS